MEIHIPLFLLHIHSFQVLRRKLVPINLKAIHHYCFFLSTCILSPNTTTLYKLSVSTVTLFDFKYFITASSYPSNVYGSVILLNASPAEVKRTFPIGKVSSICELVSITFPFM